MSVGDTFLLCMVGLCFAGLAFATGYAFGFQDGSAAKELELWRKGRLKEKPEKDGAA